jgi:hypothetical protein
MASNTALMERLESARALEPSIASAVLAELEERLAWEVLEPARAAGVELALLGVTAKPTAPFLAPTPRGTWLIASNHLDDPSAHQLGKIHIPEREHNRLVALEKAGVRCDLVWIAHELPPEWEPDQPIPPLVPPAPRFRDLDTKLDRQVRLAIERSAQVALRVGEIGLGLIAAPAFLLSEGVGLDPVILGGIEHARRDAVVWFELARWEWE